MIGRIINNYEIRSPLGEGGMGTVYLGEHTFIGRKVAIKVLRRQFCEDPEMVARFMNEARAANAIGHPNIIDIIDVGRLDDGLPYLMMEYLDGETLAQRMRREGKLALGEALAIARQAVSALAAAHAAGIVHRDLKPENFFLTTDALRRQRVKLLDFGIAKLRDVVGANPVETGRVLLGTPSYMSPEQCRGGVRVDARADVYAIGTLLFEMLCGEPPFVSEAPGDVLLAHIMVKPRLARSLNPELPAWIEAAIDRALAKNPEARFADMAALEAALTPPADAPPLWPTPEQCRVPTPAPTSATPGPSRAAAPAPASRRTPAGGISPVVPATTTDPATPPPAAPEAADRTAASAGSPPPSSITPIRARLATPAPTDAPPPSSITPIRARFASPAPTDAPPPNAITPIRARLATPPVNAPTDAPPPSVTASEAAPVAAAPGGAAPPSSITPLRARLAAPTATAPAELAPPPAFVAPASAASDPVRAAVALAPPGESSGNGPGSGSLAGDPADPGASAPPDAATATPVTTTDSAPAQAALGAAAFTPGPAGSSVERIPLGAKTALGLTPAPAGEPGTAAAPPSRASEASLAAPEPGATANIVDSSGAATPRPPTGAGADHAARAAALRAALIATPRPGETRAALPDPPPASGATPVPGSLAAVPTAPEPEPLAPVPGPAPTPEPAAIPAWVRTTPPAGDTRAPFSHLLQKPKRRSGVAIAIAVAGASLIAALIALPRLGARPHDASTTTLAPPALAATTSAGEPAASPPTTPPPAPAAPAPVAKTPALAASAAGPGPARPTSPLSPPPKPAAPRPTSAAATNPPTPSAARAQADTADPTGDPGTAARTRDARRPSELATASPTAFDPPSKPAKLEKPTRTARAVRRGKPRARTRREPPVVPAKALDAEPAPAAPPSSTLMNKW